MAAAQQALTDFRIKNHILDPQAQLAGASQVTNTLVQQLSATEIDLDMLQGTLPESDPRIAQLKRRIEVIENRMKEESSKVGGLADTDSPGYAKLMIDYQNLQMEQDFSQKAYIASLSAYDQAVNDAQHKTRYLTTYLSPTLAESSTAPDRPLRVLLALLVGFLIWSSVVMIYYALRDRR
jgi:capsular polysaccharide transport system permease protein